jgi:hypothetical protein
LLSSWIDGSASRNSRAAGDIPHSKRDAMLAWELFDKANVGEIESMAKHALQELVSAGLVQRISKGIRGNPYL